MKSFKITTPDNDVDCKAIRDCLTDMASLINDDVTVSELKPPPEVKKIETGILNIPSTTYIGLLPHTNAMFYNGNKVDLSKYPELIPLCKDIETSLDFNSIPDNALVDVVFNIDARVIGWITEKTVTSFRINNYSKGAGLIVEKREIKSIRIIEVGESK